MKTSRLTLIGAATTAVGLAGGAVAGAVAFRRWRVGPDPVAGEDFREPEGTVHRTFPARDGGEIHVVERGEGRPFLLVHGVTETSLVWHYQLLDLVAAGYRVVAVDIRGHGGSRAGSDAYTLDAMAGDVAGVVQALELRDAVAVGHSLGGMVLLQLLNDHPELVPAAISSLVLIATSARPVLGNGLPAAAAAVMRSLTPLAGRSHVRASGRPGDLAALYCRLAFGSHPSPTHVELLREASSSVPPDILARLIQTLIDLDVRHVLPSIKAPTLVIVGTRDLLTPLWHARYMANHIPVAELHVLPQCGHMVMLERRRELATLLIGFAQRTLPVAGSR